MTVAADAPSLTDTGRARVVELLRQAADTIAEIPGDTDVVSEPACLLAQLAAVRVVFDLVDSGNAAQDKAQGPLRAYRHTLYHWLADLRVPRATIAEVAGVSENAIGGAFKGERRGRPRAVNGSSEPEPADSERRRKPRPA